MSEAKPSSARAVMGVHFFHVNHDFQRKDNLMNTYHIARENGSPSTEVAETQDGAGRDFLDLDHFSNWLQSTRLSAGTCVRFKR